MLLFIFELISRMTERAEVVVDETIPEADDYNAFEQHASLHI
jgi:hypothetical protein